MKNSGIEWTDHTVNLWQGCTKVHDGCNNCYAEALTKRWGRNVWGNGNPRMMVKSCWTSLETFQKQAKRAGAVHTVFCGSLMDIFEKPMPLSDHYGNPLAFDTSEMRRQFFEYIDKGKYPDLFFLLLTKRPSNINKYIPQHWKTHPPLNVMYGTSPVDRLTFNTLVSQLLQVNGKRFLSVEPQLEKINLGTLSGIDWIIQGGESGRNKRLFDLAWARHMRDECATLQIPYFFKQIDKVQVIPTDLQIRSFPRCMNKA